MDLFDFHIHSKFSKDSEMSAEGACAGAVRMGLEAVCFTEHLDFDPNDVSYGYYDYEKTVAEMGRLKAIYKNSLRIYFGVEVSYQEEYHDQIVDFLIDKRFDLIIGSVHFVKRKFLADWVKEVEANNQERLYLPYFAELKKTAQSGLFDVIGHFDYFKRYSKNEKIVLNDYHKEIDEILDILVREKIGLEVNTSGLRHPNRTIFPDLEIVKRFKSRGGEIVTIGSDAHKIEQLGLGLWETVALLKDAGFGRIAVFEQRIPKFINL